MLNEPSVVAVEKAGNKILAVGAEARDMLGRTPQGIVAVRPLKEGVIANYTITQKMLEYIEETEEYILPLAGVLKNEYPAYSDLAFLVKYHIVSVLEAVKNLLAG